MSTFGNRSQGSKSFGEVGRHVPGETGTWVFIFGDMVIFAVFFSTYLYYRSADPLLFERSQRSLNPDYGAFNTVVLLVSSLLIVMAIRAVRLRAGNLARPLIAVAFACGLVFSALKVVEWSEKIHAGLTPAKNDFYMYYFVLTGLHWFHLIVGLVVLACMFVMARRNELSSRQFAFFEGGACFWHMVDLLWIVLFPLLYLVR